MYRKQTFVINPFPLSSSPPTPTFQIAVQSVLLPLAILGNMMVLIVLRRIGRSRSRMHFFIFHLSIADLMVAFFNMLPQLIWEITVTFDAPDVLCRFVKYMQVH